MPSNPKRRRLQESSSSTKAQQNRWEICFSEATKYYRSQIPHVAADNAKQMLNVKKIQPYGDSPTLSLFRATDQISLLCSGTSRFQTW